MKKKTIHTHEELANDPSLRWSSYQKYEIVWSDSHHQDLRFVQYENGLVRLSTINAMDNLPDLVDKLSIRRNCSEVVMSQEDKSCLVAQQKNISLRNSG